MDEKRSRLKSGETYLYFCKLYDTFQVVQDTDSRCRSRMKSSEAFPDNSTNQQCPKNEKVMITVVREFGHCGTSIVLAYLLKKYHLYE